MTRELILNLAVARALSYAKRTGAIQYKSNASDLEKALQPWYLKTRFAYRIPLAEIVKKLQNNLKEDNLQ